MKTHIPSSLQRRAKSKQGGFTLIEISLVIALLLGLIAVAFIGLGSYKKGSDKAKCKMQLAAVQKAVRSAANMQSLAVGDALPAGFNDPATPTVQTMLGDEPVCPAGGGYVWGTGTFLVPDVGDAFGVCDWTTDPTHVLTDAETSGW